METTAVTHAIFAADLDAARAALDERLRTLLPPAYQDRYETIEPRPMRSAGLKYDAQGRVAWDEIWGSFCDLAMAGGPPHKGALLEPGTAAACAAEPAKNADVMAEIGRGIELVTSMPCEPSPSPGWVRVECYGATMAAWLLRAVTMENVSARVEGVCLDLPASPHFRLEKEVKNVVTVAAKTCHYWLEHMPRLQQRAIADLLARLSHESPLVEPARPSSAAEAGRVEATAGAMAGQLTQVTGLPAAPGPAAGWLGVSCPDVRRAIWLMRALVAMNVLARREGETLVVPVNPETDPGGARVWSAVGRAWQLAGRG